MTSAQDDESLRIVTLCTGNVARSAMLGYMLTTLAESQGARWSVRTAGTHVIEGLAMSGRTRDAMMAIGELGDHHYGAHRSHQLSAEDVQWADVVLASGADHVRFVGANFPDQAAKAVQLHQFVRHAPLDAAPEDQVAWVAAMDPDEALDVRDPAGGDQAVYDAVARELWELAQVFSVLVSPEAGP